MRSWVLVLAILILGVGLVSWLHGTGRIGGSAPAPEGEPRDTGSGSRDEALTAKGPTLEGAENAPRASGLSATARVLTGTVLDDRTHVPVAGATVIAFQQDEDGLRLGTSDKTGRYTLNGLTAGEWLLTAVHRLYVPPGMDELAAETQQRSPDTMRLSVPAGVTPLPAFDLRLRTGRRFAGRVMDGTGAPVAGVQIRPYMGAGLRRLRRRLGVSTSELNARFPVWTDAEGRFEAACIPASLGEVRLAAFKPGHACRWTEPLAVDPDGVPHELELVLLESATIQGHVRYANGDPAGGCEIEIAFGSDAKREWLFEPPADATSGPDGAYALAGLPPMTVGVEADWVGPYLEGDAQEAEALRPGEVRKGIDFTVPHRFILRARLTDSAGKSLGDELLLVEGAAEAEAEPVEEEETTDDEGRIELALTSQGPLRIIHAGPGRRVVLHEAVTLPADELALVSEATARTRVELRVTDPEGKPVARFRSSMWSLFGEAERNKLAFDSDGDGRDGTSVHTVQGPPPYAVLIGQARDAEGRSLGLTTEFVRVEREPARGVVDIQLGPAGRLTGRFIDVRGRPVGGARLWLVSMQRDPDRRIAVPVTEDGMFGFDVPDTEDTGFRIIVDVPSGYIPIARVTFRAKRPHHEFVLVQGGIVAGRVKAPASSRLEGVELVFVSWEERAGDPPKMAPILSTGLDANGQFEAVGVPTDRELRVGIHDRDARKLGLFSPQDLRGVRAGQQDLVLELNPGRAIRGIVTFAEAPKHPHFVVAVPHRAGVSGDLAKLEEDGSFGFEGLPPGTYTLALLSARGRANVTLATQDVDAGVKDVAFRVGPLGSIRVAVKGDAESGGSVVVWKAGTFERRAQVSAGEAEIVIEGLPADEAYDLIVEAWDGPMGSRRSVRTGDQVTIELADSVPFAGQLQTTRPLDRSRLLARGVDGPFNLYVDEDGAFEASVMPGRYDVYLVEQDGTQHLVAKGVKAGRDDYAFTLE